MRYAGGIRSANAEISNDKAGEKPARWITKGSCPTLIGAGGASILKARPKGVVDGKQVNIPVLAVTAKGGRRRLCWPGDGCPGLSV